MCLIAFFFDGMEMKTSDIRKWFIKQHDKGNGAASKPEANPSSEKPTLALPEKPVQVCSFVCRLYLVFHLHYFL